MKEKDMEICVDYLKTVFEANYLERKAMGLTAVEATEPLMTAFAEQMVNMFQDGYQMGSDYTRNLWKEVVYDSIREEVKKHPRMSLKTYAKKHGIIKEEEEPN